jgi:6-phosphogluconolactonase
MRYAIKIVSDPAALAEEAARRFVLLADEAIAQRGHFAVALAGGSTPAGLYRLLAREPYRSQIDWERVWLAFGDERSVPPDSPDSNYRMVRETLLDPLPASEQNVWRIRGEWPGEAAADAYAETLRAAQQAPRDGARPLLESSREGQPRFDLILLGMGDDGHTASLFPGMPALAEARRPVVASGVPDYVLPHLGRVTLTLPVLNAAAHVVFLVAGAKKAPAVGAVLGAQRATREQAGDRPAVPENALPAARVQPAEGMLTWLLDEAAGKELREA